VRLEVEIKAAPERTRQTCGPERLQADLADNAIHVGIHRIKRIRRKLGLRCRQERKFKATTDSKHNLPVAPNLLDRQFAVAAPNNAWVTDITYIPTDEGWLYRAGVKDLFNGELVGYALDARMTQQLVMQASMSRKGKCCDNAPMESCWGSLKAELVHHGNADGRLNRWTLRFANDVTCQEILGGYTKH
jgi:putative transposase